MSDRRFEEGDRVVLLRDIIGLAEHHYVEDVAVPLGTIGEVVGVRECGNPTGPQGPWLYDVLFPVKVILPADWEADPEDPDHAGDKPGDTVEDVVWAIYDAQDVGELGPAPAVQSAGPEAQP